MTAKFAVGDTVIHVAPSYHRGLAKVTERTIRKVGRKYAYLEGNWQIAETPFSLEDGIEHRRSDYRNYLERIWTPAEWEAKQRREKVLQNLKLHRVSFDSGYGEPKWSTEVLEQIDALLDAALAV